MSQDLTRDIEDALRTAERLEQPGGAEGVPLVAVYGDNNTIVIHQVGGSRARPILPAGRRSVRRS